ncbi:hypothetical protein [Polyangium aurulentum]|uniref:monooxygenase n=1 Tax=Polyangium aurulentum TaxID=2567896 RepID=UPI0010AE90C7|nr:hypothetical protein [Polyangium aurulentum]UQA63068.1 hypothetical protein E8A73_022445 [Polyangium aurulentum]
MRNHLVMLGSMFLLAACAPEAPEQPGADASSALLAPPAPGKGIQLHMTSTVRPGQESYGCRLFQVPEGGLFVHDEAVHFSEGGHHVLLYRTPYKEIPKQNEHGVEVDATEVHDCSEGATAVWKVDAVLGGSETLGGEGMLHGLPEGVALPVPAGTVIVMSTHYLNVGPKPIEVDARINLYTIPEEEVTTEAGLLYIDNPILRVPPLGKSSSSMRCPIPSDVSVVNLQSHMHARGSLFTAQLKSRRGLSAETIYSTTRWTEPPVEVYEPLLKLEAGDSIEMRCDFTSTESRPVVHGLSSDDEMCQLIGPYFPRDERLEACADATGKAAATWTGTGSASGADTLVCMNGAPLFSQDNGYAYLGCVLDSCPSIEREVSAVVRCHIDARAGACARTCKGDEVEACRACLLESCTAEEKALECATCAAD